MIHCVRVRTRRRTYWPLTHPAIPMSPVKRILEIIMAVGATLIWGKPITGGDHITLRDWDDRTIPPRLPVTGTVSKRLVRGLIGLSIAEDLIPSGYTILIDSLIRVKRAGCLYFSQ